MASNWPRARRIIVVSPTLHLLQPQLIVTSPRPRQSLPSWSPIKSIRMGTGPIVLLVSSPEHILCRRAAQTWNRPIFMLPRRLFVWLQGKIDGLESNGGERRHQWWCWMALVAIARWFVGHLTWFWWWINELMEVFVVSCAWESTVLWCVLSQKNPSSRSSLFWTAH
jgi:hypothetical protein